MQLNLLMMCAASFSAVFSVLAFLAIAMRLIIILFPEKVIGAGGEDAAIYAAITSTYARLYPGTKVTGIKEIKK